ncbi:DUF4920 domain-containing protein [uncultured Croceitalea sp.]|uniref:DUF4920 domain-containing protein n=1 Tax=uncultured Croceitalea sp. TaxID=1798908 RepID=UPI0033067B0F
MKLFNKLLVIFSVVFCLNASAQGSSFGASFENVEDNGENWKVFESLNTTDTIQTQVSGKIVEVCQAKGCWMKVDLANGERVFVKFKDYGFFVPKDAASKKVVMNGKAFVEQMSVDEQRHYAEDEGVSKDEIAKITKPKKTLRFEADGVVIEKMD